MLPILMYFNYLTFLVAGTKKSPVSNLGVLKSGSSVLLSKRVEGKAVNGGERSRVDVQYFFIKFFCKSHKRSITC